MARPAHEHQPVVLRPRPCERDVGTTLRRQGSQRVTLGVCPGRSHGLVHVAERLDTHRVQQRVLVGEVNVDGRRRHPDAVGHRPDRDVVLASRFGQQLPRRGQDLHVQLLPLPTW